MRALLLLTLLGCTTLAWANEVRFQTEDGQELFAREAGRGTHGVLLLHDAGRTSADWGLIITKLESRGFRVLAIDLRGHGESATLLDDTEPDWTTMNNDVTAAIARLRKRGARSVSVIGAGLGANLALVAASQDSDLKSLILLSPGLNIKGYKPSQTIKLIGERPLLLAAAEGDRMAANTVKYLTSQSEGPHRAVVYPGEHSGTNLLDEHPQLEDQLFTWLDGHFETEGAAGEDGNKVRMGDTEQLESTGKRFGE